MCDARCADVLMPGPRLDGQSICELLSDHKVTVSAAVPTVWMMLMHHLGGCGGNLQHLNRVVIGGSAGPRTMMRAFQDVYGVEVRHGRGMTEMMIGTVSSLKPGFAELAAEALLDPQQKQGHAPFGVEMKITDDVGRRLPWDGQTFGLPKVGGPGVAKSYYREMVRSLMPRDFLTRETVRRSMHWLHANHQPRQGHHQVRRRVDLLDRGLENVAVSHPKVAEAAAIGLKHPRWSERPLLVVTLKGGETQKKEILAFMAVKIAKRWTPDDVAFVNEIPHTATGKIDKITLRERFRDYVPLGAAAMCNRADRARIIGGRGPPPP
jgi:fatty-acyl-CoA synthase